MPQEKVKETQMKIEILVGTGRKETKDTQMKIEILGGQQKVAFAISYGFLQFWVPQNGVVSQAARFLVQTRVFR